MSEPGAYPEIFREGGLTFLGFEPQTPLEYAPALSLWKISLFLDVLLFLIRQYQGQNANIIQTSIPQNQHINKLLTIPLLMTVKFHLPHTLSYLQFHCMLCVLLNIYSSQLTFCVFMQCMKNLMISQMKIEMCNWTAVQQMFCIFLFALYSFFRSSYAIIAQDFCINKHTSCVWNNNCKYRE